MATLEKGRDCPWCGHFGEGVVVLGVATGMFMVVYRLHVCFVRLSKPVCPMSGIRLLAILQIVVLNSVIIWRLIAGINST